ncbi:unnamed protein product [Darwinula stevensoni]|uniref:Membrane progestin receptor gamma n=1 Tax=Darwinula stevensoni TaxID=69355 RepID=A0A7R9A1I8_9CRUS|nr:unnamed protein product [Darwinula stevensoni]CAG0887805.1 unnamed protein product [Darwinula stevensoni]
MITCLRPGFETFKGRMRRTSSVKLLKVHEVPDFVREPAIITGYRPLPSTAKDCLESLFIPSNETINFWTHFLPTWFFVWKLKEIANTHDFFNDPYHSPVFGYMVTACLYPLASCTAHAFSGMSELARHIWYFVDYASLSIYSFGAAIIYTSYSFHESFYSSWIRFVYLEVAVILAIVCTLMACSSRFVEENGRLQKSLRLGAFVLPYLWDNVPLMYRLWTCEDKACLESFDWHFYQFLSTGLGAFFYASHYPERLAPGKFDIIGNSHNILHVCGILATANQMNAVLIDLEHRKHSFTQNGWILDEFWSSACLILVCVMNAIIVSGFSFYVWRTDLKRKDVTKAE